MVRWRVKSERWQIFFVIFSFWLFWYWCYSPHIKRFSVSSMHNLFLFRPQTWSTISLGFLTVTNSAFPTGMTGENWPPFYCNLQYNLPRPDPRNLALYTALRENPKMQALRRGMGDPPQSCKVKGFCNSEPTFKWVLSSDELKLNISTPRRLFGKDFAPVPNSTEKSLECGISVFFKRK